MELEQYLGKAHSPSTVRVYAYEIRKYQEYRGRLYAEQAGHHEVLRYIAHLRQLYGNPATIQRIVYAIKQYYCYLIATGKRTSHPLPLPAHPRCRAGRYTGTGFTQPQGVGAVAGAQRALCPARHPK